MGWAQYWSGFLDSNPETDGEYITVRVAPLTAVMNYKLGTGSAARNTSVIPGYHRIKQGEGGAGYQIDLRARWAFNYPWLTVTAASLFGLTVTFDDGDVDFLDSIAQYIPEMTVSFTVQGPPTVTVTAVPAYWDSPKMVFDVADIAIVSAIVDALSAPGSISAKVRLSGTISEYLKLALLDPAGDAEQVVQIGRAHV